MSGQISDYNLWRQCVGHKQICLTLLRGIFDIITFSTRKKGFDFIFLYQFGTFEYRLSVSGLLRVFFFLIEFLPFFCPNQLHQKGSPLTTQLLVNVLVSQGKSRIPVIPLLLSIASPTWPTYLSSITCFQKRYFFLLSDNSKGCCTGFVHFFWIFVTVGWPFSATNLTARSFTWANVYIWQQLKHASEKSHQDILISIFSSMAPLQ